MFIWFAFVFLSTWRSSFVQSYMFYQETRDHFDDHCRQRLHCHPPAAEVFSIIASHERILEPSLYVTVEKNAHAILYASFPTSEAKNLKHVPPEHPSYNEYRMNLIFRRRATAYGQFFDDVARQDNLKYNFTFVTVLRDDCTLLPLTSEALFHAGHFFGTFSHRGALNKERVLSVPDHRFIHTNGFEKLLAQLNDHAVPFTEKIPKLFWRGTSSGSKVSCMDILRVRIALKLVNVSSADFKISKPKVCHMNNTHLDFEKLGIYGNYAAEEEWIKYRAIIDVDGNFATNGLPWRVLSGSILFRVNSTNFGWIENLLQPDVHFIAIKSDLSDLHEAARLASTSNATEVEKMERITKNALLLRDRLKYSAVVRHFSLDINRFSDTRKNIQSNRS